MKQILPGPLRASAASLLAYDLVSLPGGMTIQATITDSALHVLVKKLGLVVQGGMATLMAISSQSA